MTKTELIVEHIEDAIRSRNYSYYSRFMASLTRYDYVEFERLFEAGMNTFSSDLMQLVDPCTYAYYASL